MKMFSAWILIVGLSLSLSATAIVASALVELSQYVGAEMSEHYLDEACKMLATLSSADYQSREKNPAFLLHSVGNMPAGTEVDASINYADYYYLEALLRLKALENSKHD